MDLNHSNFVACIPVYKLCSNGCCWAYVKEYWGLWAIFLEVYSPVHQTMAALEQKNTTASRTKTCRGLGHNN